MKQYTIEQPPKIKNTNAYKIWTALSPEIWELHYNANNYGNSKENGWGTWACHYEDDMYFCGIDSSGVYLQQMNAPFRKRYKKEEKEE